MEVKQIYEILNSVQKEVLGQETEIIKEDLTGIVDLGKTLLTEKDTDNYVKSLVDKVGKVIFSNRVYTGNAPSVLKDSWEYGSILQKIDADLIDASENESWELVSGTDYSPNVFYKPTVTNKFFNSRVTFEIPLSFTTKQIKSSFNSETEMNGFVSMLYNTVEQSMTVKLDSLIMRTINNMIALTYLKDSKGVRAINVLKSYNEKTGKTLKAAQALNDSEFLRFASTQIALTAKRFNTMTTIFNNGKKARFTNRENTKIVMLADFVEYAKKYLYGDTINQNFILLPPSDIVAYWQGSGDNFDFDNVSKINVTVNKDNTNTDVELNGIIGVMFDSNSLGVTNTDRRVTTNYNPKAEFYNNWFKFDACYFNDENENFVVFYIKDV